MFSRVFFRPYRRLANPIIKYVVASTVTFARELERFAPKTFCPFSVITFLVLDPCGVTPGVRIFTGEILGEWTVQNIKSSIGWYGQYLYRQYRQHLYRPYRQYLYRH